MSHQLVIDSHIMKESFLTKLMTSQGKKYTKYNIYDCKLFYHILFHGKNVYEASLF